LADLLFHRYQEQNFCTKLLVRTEVKSPAQIMNNILIAFIFIFLAVNTINAQELPYYAPKFSNQSLHTEVDFQLQNLLVQKLNENPKWKSLIKSKRMAVGLVDLRNVYHPKFARVNGNEMMYAASLPKIAVLLAATDAIEKGELKETQAVKNDMRLMIAKSNNAATTRMIDRVGYRKIEKVLTNPDYRLYDRSYGGGLWVGKRYAAGGARYPDPMKGISHAATVSQICRFYYMLSRGELVSQERSEQMLGYLGNPELHHKFVNTLDRIAPEADVYRKSGSWRTFHSDSALVWGPDGRQYIIAAMVEDSEGGQIMKDLIYVIEDVLEESGRVLATK
jgi:beta-lactamase class A